MKTVIVKNDGCTNPKLMDIKDGAMIEYQGNVYIKMAKSKIGQGLNLIWPHHHSILFNVKYGSCRAVCADERVQILEQVEDLRVCRLKDRTDISQYLRHKC